MRVLGCIIAGGTSSRMGQEKALMQLGGEPLITHVAKRLAIQVEQLSVNANGEAERFTFLNLPIFNDHIATGGTPLAGLHAALHFAKTSHFDAVLSVPADTPFLPLDLRSRLETHATAVASLTEHAEVVGEVIAMSPPQGVQERLEGVGEEASFACGKPGQREALGAIGRDRKSVV